MTTDNSEGAIPIQWAVWENTITENGITIDRPIGSTHPRHKDIIYPISYGYINGTKSSDGQEVDIFVGSAANGLVGAIATRDFRKGDREIKLLFNCSPTEIYVVNGFINFDKTLMIGRLYLRWPMADIGSITGA